MSRIHEGMFTSERMDWATPQAFFDLVAEEFDFTLDAAASPSNAKCARFFTEDDDGLKKPWRGVVWCNPPYGRAIAKWVEKGCREAQQGATVVMLIPARTDTAYWHDYVMRAAEVRLIRGRLVFGQGEATSNAPFPSALVVFRPGSHSPKVTTMTRGAVTRRAARGASHVPSAEEQRHPYEFGSEEEMSRAIADSNASAIRLLDKPRDESA